LFITVGIWLVRLPQTIELSTDLHWRINYIQCYAPLILVTMINKIIEESIKIGIPIKCEYVPSRGFVYEVDDFYKSGTISIEEEGGKLIATARYNEKTEINEPKDIVNLNYEWWCFSKDRFNGWRKPSETWEKLFDMYGLDCA